MQKPIKIIANWKSILTIFIISLFFLPSGFAADVNFTFQWDANHSNDNVVKYRIYWRATSGDYNVTDMKETDGSLDLNKPQWTITLSLSDPDAIMYFVVTAVDDENFESDYSKEVATVGFTVSAISGNTTEDGGTATFTVRLNTQPTEDVTIGVSSSDTTEGTVSPASLTFTNVNWNVNQTVTVTGVDDAIDDGNQSYTVVLAAAVSDDANYKNLNPDDVSVTNNDNDTAGFTVSAISGDTSEDLGTATFTVRLNSEPTNNITIGVSSSDTTEGTVSPASLTFTNVNWNVNQTVTVTGVDDDLVDGNQSYTVVLAAAVSDDANYKNLNPDDVSVTNNDNDTASNNPPKQAVLSSPENGATVSLTPKLQTEAFSDPDGDAHAATLWKIRNDNTSEVVFNVTSTVNLISLNVPDFVLTGNTPYSWTVIFYDNNGASSSEATASFTTADEEPFPDNNPPNGIPDDQEVAETVDVNDNDIFDVDEISDNYKSVNTVDENDKVVGQIGISTADDISATIAMLIAVNPADLPDTGKPDDLPLGLVSFKLNVTDAEVDVTIYLSEAAPADAHWYKYSPASGWLDCTARGYAPFSDDRTSVILTLEDGGFGDADGVENGVIIDPSGFGTPSATPGNASGGGCFIATAAYGSPLDKHVDILRRLRDNILLPTKWGQGFAKAYYRYSPPVADFIRDHDTARLMTRWSLLPVVGLSWVALQIGAVPTLLVLMAGLLIVFGVIGRKFARIFAD